MRKRVSQAGFSRRKAGTPGHNLQKKEDRSGKYGALVTKLTSKQGKRSKLVIPTRNGEENKGYILLLVADEDLLVGGVNKVNTQAHTYIHTIERWSK